MAVFVFDTEIIGDKKPCFLVGCKNIETQEVFSFWGNKKAHRQDFADLLLGEGHTWVSFNGIKFDDPLVTMWLYGYDEKTIKLMATQIITSRMMPWDVYRSTNTNKLEYDHIDLIEVAPGVMTSLKIYAGRMHYKSLVDLPFPHDLDLTPKQKKTLEAYCHNDLGVTEALYRKIEKELALRVKLSEEHGIDLRSKSDAQVAEAILKKKIGIQKSTKNNPPLYVQYKAPSIIKTSNPVLKELIEEIESERFAVNQRNGSPELPIWLAEKPIELKNGIYQCGIGGLHSKHDKKFYAEAGRDYMISDFDVASYYPTIILNVGLVPRFNSGRGEAFLEEYQKIYDMRLEAKKRGDKKTSDALKISLNGTFGKLGNIYSPFYAPDLLLAVTITGQLNLLCLIAELIKHKDVEILSANTDGIMVGYKVKQRDKVLKTIAANSKRTGFEYEETQYLKVGMKDVNNYNALKTNMEVKSKGLYADTGLMKNPTMSVCSLAVEKYLIDGTPPEETIRSPERNITEFVTVRNVTGGVEQEGINYGRVARWYMTTQKLSAIRYAENGNLVPKGEGGKICMILPDTLPEDLDYNWYIHEAYSMLSDMGVFSLDKVC